jgi:hypothetical protein
MFWKTRSFSGKHHHVLENMIIPVLINPQSGSGLLDSSGKRKDEQPIAEVGPTNFRSQFGSDQRCPAAAADACRNGDVLFALRQISDRKSLRRSRQAALPEDLPVYGVVSVRMTIPVSAKHQFTCSREGRRIHRRRSALPPQDLPGSEVHRQELARDYLCAKLLQADIKPVS